MKMEAQESSCDSLPYIDDEQVDDETTPHQYNLKISENYQDKNRNIEISNRFPNDIAKYFGTVVPTAEESEPSNCKDADKEPRKQVKCLASSGMKLVIKGWNSSISIQGLDNKSSITFKRKCEKLHKKESRSEERMGKASVDESKMKRGRWKTLTKSLMLARSARFERRGADERYPKYVLLKNEDEDSAKVKENYPKMFVFNERKQKGNAVFKPEFNLKKPFKNKTEPIIPLEEILARAEESQDRKPNETTKTRQKQPLTDRCRGEKNVMVKKRITVEREKSLKPSEHTRSEPSSGFLLPQSFVCNEIQGIFEDLKVLPQNLEIQQQDGTREAQNGNEPCGSVPPQYCQFSCRDPYCCVGGSDRTPKYVSVYSPPKYMYQTSNARTCENATEEQNVGEDLDGLPFGILSSFFPRVVIMNAIRSEEIRGEDRKGETFGSGYGSEKPDTKDSEPLQEEVKVPVGLQIPQQDLSLKSKLVQQPVKLEPEDSNFSDDSLKESSDEELKTKTQESEATTEYLQYSEFPEPSGNESPIDRHNAGTPPPRPETKETAETSLSLTQKYEISNGNDNPDNLTLTKIGYKMYDNLTKLSLNREKDIKTAEVSGCGCNGNETKKSPYNITLESSRSVVKVTVPENELNFQFVNSQGAGIQIGVGNAGRGSSRQEEEEEKKIARQEDLWHSDGGGRAVVLQNGGTPDGGFQKLKVSLGDNKDVILSIEMSERDKKEEKTKEKRTKEMKVGTDDFDLAGGDFAFSGGSHKNLSPRIGRLLKHLHDKLESDERERKFLDEKINQKLLHQEGVLPGVFLVKHISPRNQVARKPSEVPAIEKPIKLPEKQDKTGELREYYCEECLATMRIFEDENPSVKSMVDKFETIIQLESY